MIDLRHVTSGETHMLCLLRFFRRLNVIETSLKVLWPYSDLMGEVNGKMISVEELADCSMSLATRQTEGRGGGEVCSPANRCLYNYVYDMR